MNKINCFICPLKDLCKVFIRGAKDEDCPLVKVVMIPADNLIDLE
jgi:hypothetical protein